MGSYTWRYRLEPTSTGTTLTESYDAEPPVPKPMSWLTEKWVGSSDRDADLHDGMTTTLQRIKAAAEIGLILGTIRAAPSALGQADEVVLQVPTAA